MTLDEICAELQRHPARHVVVTGGEPMIAPEIVPLTERLRALGVHITVETAGTVFKPVACDLMSISPKLANSTPEGRMGGAARAVAAADGCIAEADGELRVSVEIRDRRTGGFGGSEVTRSGSDAPAERIVLCQRESTLYGCGRELCGWRRFVRRKGYRFSPRLHVDLYGNRRGV